MTKQDKHPAFLLGIFKKSQLAFNKVTTAGDFQKSKALAEHFPFAFL